MLNTIRNLFRKKTKTEIFQSQYDKLEANRLSLRKKRDLLEDQYFKLFMGKVFRLNCNLYQGNTNFKGRLLRVTGVSVYGCDGPWLTVRLWNCRTHRLDIKPNHSFKMHLITLEPDTTTDPSGRVFFKGKEME